MPKQLANQLTILKVKSQTKPGVYCDGGGLYLQVRSPTNKSWIFRYTPPGGGKPRHLGLGPVVDVTLAEARDKRDEARRKLRAGVDPLGEARAQRAAVAREPARPKVPTFEECAILCFAALQTGTSVRHQQRTIHRLEKYAFPKLGPMPINLPTSNDVLDVLTPIWTTLNPTADRLRRTLSQVFKFAVFKQYRSDDPAAWDGYLEHALASPGKVHAIQSYEAVDIDKIGSFMRALRVREGSLYRATEFTILTAVRSHMVRDAEWAEIVNGVWTIPAEKMKSRRDPNPKEHRVPLTRRMMAILDEMRQIARNQYVFPGVTAERVSENAIRLAVKEVSGDDSKTIHGLRATFRTWVDDKTNFDPNLAEMALAHALPGAVAKAYRRGTMLEKRRVLMQAWEDYCGR